MALVYPLSFATFMDQLNVQSVKWRLERFDELSGLENGQTLGAERSSPLWSADVVLSTMTHAEAARVQALVEAMEGVIHTFYLYAPQLTGPILDPDGTALGASVPRLNTVNANNKSIRLDSLPATYKLSVGDLLSFDYNSGNSRALHRVVEASTAVAGVTPLFEVRPHLRPGWTINSVVTLVKASTAVFITPGSFDPGTATTTVTKGMAFKVMQRVEF